MLANADPVALLGSISSLIGTLAVAYVAVSARRAANAAITRDTKADRARAATARTSAATAVKLAEVGKKVDTNTAVTEAIHTEVKAINGTTGTELLEATEGRRIEADIPAADRTHDEAGYVTRLHEDDPPAP